MPRKLNSTAFGILLVLATLSARPLAAWDPDAHEAIVRAALVLSPAAESRLPAEFRDALFSELRNADMLDRICRTHRGPDATRQAHLEAARAFAELASPAAQRPYARARAIGRYLHYVADCAVPTPIADGRVYQIPDFWSNIDLIVYRERRARSAQDLATTLRTAGAEAQWGDDGPNSWSSIFRLAVNLTADALLLLPPRPGAARLPDEGPVLFMVNRQDTGRGASHDSLWLVDDGEYLFVAAVRTGEAGPIKRDLMRRRGVQVAEVTTHSQAGGKAVRALLFNNGAAAACDIRMKAGKWTLAAGNMAPGSLLPLSFELPPGVDLGRVKVTWTTSDCPAGATGAIPAASRIVLGSTGSPPRFDRGATDVLATAEPASPLDRPGLAETVATKAPASRVFADAPPVFPVTIDPAAEPEVRRVVEVRSFKMRPVGGDWQFLLSVQNLLARPLGRLELRVDVAYAEPGTGPSHLTLAFQGGEIGARRGGEMTATTVALGRHPVSFRLVGLRQFDPPAAPRAPVVTNRLRQP